MKKILITGAGGFIGSHLTELCAMKGYKVRALVHYNSMNSWGWLDKSKYKNKINVHTGDVRNFDSVFEAMKGCDTIFHLAALIGIPYSYSSPLAYIRTNIEGTYNILQAAKILSAKRILITSTSETYGTAQYVPIDEKHPLVGQSPYSASKISADQIALSFYRSFNLPVKVVRPFNTYGPRQSARAIIPSIVVQILNGKKEIKLGNLNPKRDLTYVKDMVGAFLAIADSKRLIGEVTNIGMGQEISIGDLAELISKLINKKIKIVKDTKRVRPNKSEVLRLCCDNKKLTESTDWKPRYNIQRGLKETIKWIRANKKLYKAEIYNV